jgi:hypothetical protein
VLDYQKCEVKTAGELDAQIRDIFALDNVGRGAEISGTLNVEYSDETVKQATLLPLLEARGVRVAWHKKPPTRKGYIIKWERREAPDKLNRHTIDYLFCSRPDNAAYWETRERAEQDCVFFDQQQITISLPDCATRVCQDFQVEERPAGDFVIFCEVPFDFLNASGQSVGD